MYYRWVTCQLYYEHDLLVIGEGHPITGITLLGWIYGARCLNISFQINENLGTVLNITSHSVSNANALTAMMFRVNSAERHSHHIRRKISRIGVPFNVGSTSIISTKQATIGTKQYHTVYHNYVVQTVL